MRALTEAQRTLRDFQARQDDWRIRDWQLALTDGETITVGLKDNEVGGVYAPPTTRRVVGGSLYVVWHDGQVSRSAVDARFLNHLETRLKEMRRAAYEEAFIIDMPEDAVPPPVQVFDPEIAKLVRDDSEPCFHALRKAGGLLSHVRESYDGSVSAAIASLAVSNSRGLDRAVETTSHGFGFSADSVFGVGHRSRRILGLDSVEEHLLHLNDWLPAFHEIATEEWSIGSYPVVLLPGAAASFLGTFVLGNLDGEAIANKSSAWAQSDFESQRSVFHEAFSLKFDPTVDWLSRSYRMDGRGLMAESACYIENGRLQRPVASLKAARQLSCLPTPVPSASGISLTSSLAKDLDAAIRELDQGVIVPDVLGMHTQDASRGAYSLSVPSALLVKNGRIIGRRRATLAGNFFDDLASPIAALKSPIYDMVGLGFAARLNF